MENKYSHLNVPPLKKEGPFPTVVGTLGKRSYKIRKFLLSNPCCSRIVRRLHRFCNGLEALEKSETMFAEILQLQKQDALDAHHFGSPYGYEDDLRELEVAIKYKKQIDEGRQYHQAESGKFYDHAEATVTNLLTADPSIKCFVNFGVSHAYVDSLLAKKFPQVKFIGIDRSLLTKTHNEMFFSSLPNMEFVAADVFEFLKKREWTDSIFFEMRTAPLLPKYFLDRLYNAVSKAKFKYIVGLEQIGFSRQTFEQYEFSDSDQPSVGFRDCMYIHNYPGLLKKAGYSLARAELVKTDHPHPDYRIFSFTGIANR